MIASSSFIYFFFCFELRTLRCHPADGIAVYVSTYIWTQLISVSEGFEFWGRLIFGVHLKQQYTVPSAVHVRTKLPSPSSVYRLVALAEDFVFSCALWDRQGQSILHMSAAAASSLSRGLIPRGIHSIRDSVPQPVRPLRQSRPFASILCRCSLQVGPMHHGSNVYMCPALNASWPTPEPSRHQCAATDCEVCGKHTKILAMNLHELEMEQASCSSL